MPAFCGNCGAPVGETSGECGKCGARTGPEVPRANFAPVGAASGGGGSVVKIVLIAFGVLFVLGAVSLGGMYYAAHRYLKVAEEVTGVKVGDVTRAMRDAAKRGGSHQGRAETRDGCLLLSKAEASAILGIEVERSDGKPNADESGEHCSFFVKPGSIAQHEKSPIREGDKTLQDRLDEVKLHSRIAIEGDPHGQAPYFTYTVEREDGKTACAAVGIANRLSGVGTIDGTGEKEPLGVGDKAVMGIGEGLMCVAKGNSSITLDLNQIAGARAIGIAVAQKILPRL